MRNLAALMVLGLALSLGPVPAAHAAIPAGEPLMLIFPGNSSQLTLRQMSLINTFLAEAANRGELAEVHCQGLQHKKDSKSKKIIAVKRAMAVCAHAEKAVREFSVKPYFFYDSGHPTPSLANSGKVALRLYFWKSPGPVAPNTPDT